MTTVAQPDAVRRLIQSYPDVSQAVVVRVLHEAGATVLRLMGRPDLEIAEDLARLRLDVRTRRFA